MVTNPERGSLARNVKRCRCFSRGPIALIDTAGTAFSRVSSIQCARGPLLSGLSTGLAISRRAAEGPRHGNSSGAVGPAVPTAGRMRSPGERPAQSPRRRRGAAQRHQLIALRPFTQDAPRHSSDTPKETLAVSAWRSLYGGKRGKAGRRRGLRDGSGKKTMHGKPKIHPERSR